MTEQPLPNPGQVSVTENLIQWLREREARGIATYGRSLETFNGRSATRDLREELVDALQYAHQWELERSALLNQIEGVRQRITDLEVDRGRLHWALGLVEDARTNSLPDHMTTDDINGAIDHVLYDIKIPVHLRPEVRAFAQAMEAMIALRQDKVKPFEWQTATLNVEDELREIVDALFHAGRGGPDIDYQDIADRAIYIANYAMAIYGEATKIVKAQDA